MSWMNTITRNATRTRPTMVPRLYEMTPSMPDMRPMIGVFAYHWAHVGHAGCHLVQSRDHRRSRPGRVSGNRVHPGHHAEEAHRPAQLSGHRAPALFPGEAGRVLPAVLLPERPRRAALQSRHARLGVPPRQG